MTRDVMDRLAKARPNSLDPAADPSRRERDLVRALDASLERRRIRLVGRPQVLVAGGLALAAAIAFAYGGVVKSDEPHADKRQTPAPVQNMSPKQVLIAAATSAASKPATSGKYWRVTDLSSRKPTGRSNMITASYYAKDGRNWRGTRILNGPAAGKTNLTTVPPLRTRSKPFEIDVQDFSLAEIQSIPDTPAGVERWVCRNAEAASVCKKGDRDSAVDQMIFRLLVDAPVRPATRAAAFRLLATRPGVQDGGIARDELGRTGHELRFGPGGRDRILVDPVNATLMRYIAEGPTGFSGTFLPSVWTDEKPHVPDAP